MAEKKKNPTPQELAECFIDQVSRSRDKRSYDWYGDYSFEDCVKGMDLTYYNARLGWTPLTVAIGRASRYFGEHSPCLRSLAEICRSGRVSLDVLSKQPEKDVASGVVYAANYPDTFAKMLAFLFLDDKRLEPYFEHNKWTDLWEERYRSGLTVEKAIEEVRRNPKYDEKRIFSPEFWNTVAELDSDKKMAYRHCPGFKAEWLLDDYKYFKEGEREIDNPTLVDALEKFNALLSEEPKLKSKVDELKQGVKRLNIEYNCYSHYGEGLFGGPRFYDYDGQYLTPEYLENLNKNFPNIQEVSLPEIEQYRRNDFHYKLENELGDAQFEAISKFANVKNLHVGYQPYMTSGAFSSICTMKNLESVSFSNMEIKEEDLEKLLKLSKLQELSLAGCKYNEDLIRKNTGLLCINEKWVGPEHPDYEKARKIEDERLAELHRIESLTGKDWKEKFHEAMAEDRKRDAIEILRLNHVFEKRGEFSDSSWGRDKPEDVGPHVLQRWGTNRMHVQNDCLSQDIIELGGENVAIASLYEDRSWRSNQGYSGGVGWYWNGEVAVVNLDKGVGDVAETGTLCVRDPDNGNRDIFQYIDRNDILSVEKGKATVRLGRFASASVVIPEVSKKEDIYLRDRQAKKLKTLRRGNSSLKDTLEKGQTGRQKAMEEAQKFHASRKQKTPLKFL